MPTAVNNPPRRDSTHGNASDVPARGTPARPTFTKVRRGYDVAEVDRYIDGLLRRLSALPDSGSPGPSAVGSTTATAEDAASGGGKRQRDAFEAGTVLLDAREAADRVKTEAEVAAAALVADAETEARRLVAEGRTKAERALADRRRELLRELKETEDTARSIRNATARVKGQVDEWRQAALQSHEQVAAALEHWPAEVPNPTELDQFLASSQGSPSEGTRS